MADSCSFSPLGRRPEFNSRAKASFRRQSMAPSALDGRIGCTGVSKVIVTK
jgi:hypothetical protein